MNEKIRDRDPGKSTAGRPAEAAQAPDPVLHFPGPTGKNDITERNSAENDKNARQTIYCRTPGRISEKGTALSGNYLGLRLCGACSASLR
ncbi:MAG: hypothetical protein NT022_11485 [Deltaproteobacteria bacterium]|nr:hypothetical protein [Deltaproteobacteria bacterium]